ncbi:MAG: helix-turn-helix domain-containing protein [Candidatus Eisenbacteria bacterium]|nr:helix-turn-helix domain-containing protein [Candidatus Eisenbacteria bacterium]
MSSVGRREGRVKTRTSIPVRESSGDVFADIGVAESAEASAKAEIAVRIAGEIEARGLTQTKAAGLLDVSQAEVSNLMRGRLKGFSTDRLFRFLTALGQDVKIVIVAHRRSRNRAGLLQVLDERPRASVAGVRGRR